MPSRERYVLQTIAALSRRSAVEVIGERGSGRSHVLAEVRDHFAALRWEVLEVPGIPTLRHADMSALSFAGITATAPADAVADLASRLGRPDALIVVDDWEHVDAFSRAVLLAVQERCGAPLLSSRLSHSAELKNREYAVGGVRVQLEPFTVDALGAALRSRLGSDLDPATLAALWVKSGGNIGAAVAMVADAEISGRLGTQRGALSISGELWTDRLSASAAMVIAPLDNAHRDALELFARFGPIPLGTGTKLLPIRLLQELETDGYLVMRAGDGEPSVQLARPQLVEYFRSHEVSAGFLAYAASCMAGVGVAGEAVGPALMGPLTRMSTMVKVGIARDAWARMRTQASGAALAFHLLELGATTEAGQVLEQAGGAGGSAESVLALERVRADHTRASGTPALAVARLRARAAELPQLATPLLARSVVLECVQRGTADAGALPQLSADLTEAERAEVRRAQAFLDLSGGNIAAAARELATLWRDMPDDDGVYLVAVLADIAQGRTEDAIRTARRRMADAARDVAEDRRHLFGYAAALAATVGRHDEQFESVTAEFRGATHASGPALAARAAMAAMAALAPDPGDDDGATPWPGPAHLGAGLPGMSAEWHEAARHRRAGRLDEASAVLFGYATELWATGARYSAALSFLYAAELSPTAERLQALEDRVCLVDGAGLTVQSRLIAAFARSEFEDVPALLAECESLGQLTRAQAGWAQLAAQRPASHKEAVLAERESARMLASMAPAGHEPGEVMTARERQIVRMVASGMSNAEIARELVLSVRTIESHLHRAMRKAGRELRAVLGSSARAAAPGSRTP